MSYLSLTQTAEGAAYQFTPTGGQLVTGTEQPANGATADGNVADVRLAGKFREADKMTVVIERDGEVAKQAHTAQDEWRMLMRRKDTPQAKRIGTDFHRQPSLIDPQPTTFDAEKRILGTPSEVDPQFSFRDGSGDHRAIGASIDEKIKWQIPVAR